MKNIPDLMTSCRILLTLFLPFTTPFDQNFLIIYTLCGVSDIVDGYLARKLKCSSDLGTFLDTLADTLFLFLAAGTLLVKISLPLWLLRAALVILVFRLFTYTIGFIRFRQWTSLHTWLNKLTGLLLFLTPYLYNFISLPIWGIIVVVVAVLSVLDELLIVALSKKLDKNCRSFFSCIIK
ncbi:CDP-alcohol phosphatidyltransferase family protein [Enterococcus sp. AZ072]|uniref:CDP-alcohol phosphatidyltransferase family protein n=1 Tax=unclassified Enterococcus TaxID=2608891 RepID=UPI003D26B01A